MPHMVTEMIDLRGALTADFPNLGSELKGEMMDLREGVETLEARVQRGHEKQSEKTAKLGSVLKSLTGVLQLIAGGVLETRLRLPDDEDTLETERTACASTGGFTSKSIPQDNASANPERSGTYQPPQQRRNSSHTNARPSTAASSSNLAAISNPAATLSLGSLIHAAERSVDGMRIDELSTDRDDSVVHSSRKKTQSASAAAFVLESNHATVSALRREWYEGVFDRPSTAVMIERKLPKSKGQRTLFTRRRIIIDEVTRLARDKVIPESEVVERLAGYRSRNKLSITKLQDEIRRKRAKDESII